MNELEDAPMEFTTRVVHENEHHVDKVEIYTEGRSTSKLKN